MNVLRRPVRCRNHRRRIQADRPTNPANPRSRLRGVRYNEEVKRAVLFLIGLLTSGPSDIIFCVPLFVELWSKDPTKLEYLKTIHGLVCLLMAVVDRAVLSWEIKNQWFAGAPLKKSVGDYIVSQGVTVFQLYGW